MSRETSYSEVSWSTVAYLSPSQNILPCSGFEFWGHAFLELTHFAHCCYVPKSWWRRSLGTRLGFCKFLNSSPNVIAYYSMRSKTGGGNGLGTRLKCKLDWKVLKINQTTLSVRCPRCFCVAFESREVEHGWTFANSTTIGVIPGWYCRIEAALAFAMPGSSQCLQPPI